MKKIKQPRFHCKTEKQKKAIRRSYAIKNSKKAVHISAPYPHFRYYRKSGHPALIIGETKNNNVEEYRFRKVMHSERENGRKNEMLYPNPNPKDKEPMYITKRIRHDIKENFENKPLSWKYPKK